MKLLAADVGNTNITLGLFTDGELAGSWRATTHTGATPDEIAAMTAELLALDGHRLDELEAVALASVVPPLTSTFERFIRTRIGIEPIIVDATSLAGTLAIEIDRPAEAGADRLCNALAARTEFGGPAIVIDVGTSTNFDLLSAEGAYIGGAIAPGLGLSLEALVGYASKLPRIELRRPPHAILPRPRHAQLNQVLLDPDQLPRQRLALLQYFRGSCTTLVAQDRLEIEQLPACPLDAIDGR